MCFGRWGKYIKDCNVEDKYVLTPYLINDGNIHPAAIVCPGGGYKMICDHMEGKPVAEYLNSKGINAFVLRYRFKHEAHYPNPQDDIARAVQELIDRQEEFHIDMNNFSLWGFSAGGHLCASYGLEYIKRGLPKPNCLVLVYPVITLGEHTHKGTKKYLIGSKASEEEINAKSIHTNVNEKFPKTFIWAGDKDISVPPVNSDMLVEKLEQYNIPHLYKKYHGVGHGVGLGIKTTAEGWADIAIDYWLNNKN